MGALKELLAEGRTIILDSAMGTELQKRGCNVTLPLWSAASLFDRPDTVRHIHIDNIDTGADIITTNTFRTQRRTYEKAGHKYHEKDFAETARHYTTDAVDLAKDAVMIAAEENEVMVAGGIAPLEDSYRPDLTPDSDALAAEHHEHMKNLADAGVDIFIAETLTNIREITAVLEELKKFDLDSIISITPRNDRELFSGEPLSEAVNVINQYSPDVLCVNCIHPHMVEYVLNYLKTLTEIPLGAYANIGDPNYKSDPKHKEGDPMKRSVSPDEYFNYAKKWKAIGARVIGGCCGTNPLYISKLSALKKK